MSDELQLLQEWQAGDSKAGQLLFRRYYAAVARFFANKLSEAPGDLVQETFMACVAGRDRIRDGGSFRSYLFAVAYRVLTNHLRRRYRAPEALGSTSALELDPSPSTMMGRSEEQRLLLQALRRLPVELQVLLELRYWEQLSSAEISHALGIPANTVRGRLRRARLLLGDALRHADASPDLVHSTLSDLEGWARKVRDGLRDDG